jgi:hypothetical protein
MKTVITSSIKPRNLGISLTVHFLDHKHSIIYKVNVPMTPKKYTQTENVIILNFDLNSKSFVKINCTAFETITIRM